MAKTTIATQDLKQERNATAEGADAFVFLDQRGKRWPRFKRYLLLVAVVGLLGLLVFLKTLLVPSDLEAPPAAEQIRTRLMALTLPGQADQTVTKPLWRNFARGDEGGNGAMAHDKGPGAQAHFPDKDRSQDGAAEIRLGFYESWDSASLTSLKAHAAQLTHLAPDWLTFEDGQGEIKVNAADDLIDLAHEDGLALVPLLRNMDTNQVWQPEAVETLLNGPSSGQDRFTTNLVTRLQELGAAGVLIDWQEIDPYYKNALSGFLARIAIGLHAEGLELWLSVPARRQLVLLDLEYLAAHVDHFVANLYDENAELGPAGPVASQDFFSGWLDTLVKGYGTPAQWIIGIGSYGYDWQEGDAEAELISFEDAMVRASSSQQASLTLEAPFFNPHYAYRDQNAVHEIWFLDAVTFMNQLAESRDHQVGGIAVFRLGTEDPDIWHLLDLDLTRPLSPTDLAELELISPGEAMAHVGQGSLLTIKDHRADGLRRLSLDQGTGGQLPASARYEKFPGYLSLIHEGVGPKDAVTITFDDGPDPEWTPALLDILKAEGVQATFFLIGANMERHPDLVRRIVQEGHMIGVHTFTHPNLAEVSEERASLELNATQRLIESITGQSTILFRPPYNADYNPDSPEEVVPIQIAQRLGYLTVTMDIDPEDWDKPGVETMLERVRTGRRQGGSVVLLHDAGGDRAQTVEVLPQIIHYLRARGDTILPLPAILGIPAAQLMPKVPEHDQPVLRMISESGFEVIRILSNLLWGLLILATVLTLCKTLVVSGLALRSRRAERLARAASGWPPAKCPPEECPPVSVLVAAYNEAKVIRQTLLTVLSTRYPGPLEVIVVDDGSVDGTGDIVMALARQDERVRLIRQPNRGKARALSNGLNQARHAIIVSLDADTQFQPDTISELVRPFTNPCVGAVSGRARVGNLATLFGRFQSLEYSCGFNLDRRAYDQWNCITVVPGAVSAFRLEAIRAAGGISTDTLAEDTDLTLSLHRQGYLIRYAPEAVAWTEAPETARTFARQRFRWAFGTLQCLWKHRDLLFSRRHGALGWFSLPNAWFFNFVLAAIGLLVDTVLLVALLLNPTNLQLYAYFFIFIAADILLAVVAYWIEREPMDQVWLILPMRLIYRPVFNYAVAKAILKALKGVWVGWGKLDRTASVSQTQPEGLQG